MALTLIQILVGAQIPTLLGATKTLASISPES
jgi:hypothetical protein